MGQLQWGLTSDVGKCKSTRAVTQPSWSLAWLRRMAELPSFQTYSLQTQHAKNLSQPTAYSPAILSLQPAAIAAPGRALIV